MRHLCDADAASNTLSCCQDFFRRGSQRRGSAPSTTWQLNERQIIQCASPAHLAKQLQGHQFFANAPIVHAWIPVGSTRDALMEPAEQLQRHGVALQPVLSDWDQLAWPHATKGFFQLRTRIPELLNELNESSGLLL
jgi:hypothetical protein